MQPLGKITLAKNANDENRIGPNKRNEGLFSTAEIEQLLEKTSPLAITCDVRSTHPPYFSEFCYHDVLNGIQLITLSAEVTARMSVKAAAMTADKPFPLGEVMDKYQLGAPVKKYRKVIFLAGSNATNLMDQSKIQKLMVEDDEWVIKLHPVTQEKMIRELASIYGYHRLIDPKISGMEVLKNCEEMTTMSTSEMFLLGRMLGKPVINVSRYDREWLCCYYHITRLLDNTDKDYTVLNNVLMSDISGHLRYSYGEERCKELAENYFTEAMKIREQFRMIVNQKLSVADKTFVDWK